MIRSRNSLVILVIAISYPWFMGLRLMAKPVNFLFADDWLISEYLNPQSDLSNIGLGQLVNGHNLMSTKIELIVLSRLVSEHTLLIFAILNIITAIVAFILILTNKKCETRNKIALFCAVVVFFNFKQAQNFSMIISAHFIHSILAISSYLYLKNSRRESLRLIPLIVSPFTGAMGLSVLGIDLLQLFKDRKVRSPLNIGIISITIFFVFMFSYGINLLTLNQISNPGYLTLQEHISLILSHPQLILNYLLSTLGGQFFPSSRFSVQGSQIFGLCLAILLFKSRRNILRNVLTRDLFLIGVLATLLFLISGYDGTWHGLSNAYSNRYTSGSLFLILSLFLAIPSGERTRKTQVVYLGLSLLVIVSGVKSGSEWINIRHTQSLQLQEACKNYYANLDQECLEQAFSRSIYSDKEEFMLKLKEFTKLHMS